MPSIRAGEGAARVLKAWELLAPVLPPDNWRPPPPAGYIAAQGMRRVEDDPWRPVTIRWLLPTVHTVPLSSSTVPIELMLWVQAGEDDGSCFLRPMTDAELKHQSQLAAGVA